MKYGLSEITIEKIRGVFEAFPEIETAILYGSRAKGNFKPTSDIDLTLYGDALTPDLRLTIASEIDDLLLPYTIDLSIFNELNHAKLREHIERVGVVFYERKKQGTALKIGWVKRKLGDVTTKIGSGATPLGGEEAYKVTGISLIRSLNVYDDGFRDGKLARIDDVQASRLSNVIVEADDVLLNITGASVARCCLVPAHFLPARVNQHVSIIRPIKQKLSPAFLHYLLISKIYKDRLLHTGEEGGSTRQAITKTQLQGFSIEYPESLLEQQRIVRILDKAFDCIATAKTNAEKNLRNARAIFESHLQSVFIQRCDGWVQTTLGSEIDLLTGFPFKSTQYTDSENSVRLLRGDNIVQGTLRWDDVKKWPASGAVEYNRYQLCAGDVVLAMDRPWVKAGLKCSQISPYDLPCLLVQRTARLRGNNNLDNRFLFCLISSNAFTRHILGVQTGIGVPHISGHQIKDFRFLKPPVKDQVRIAGQLEDLSVETQRLGSIYQQKIAALEDLKKSLLHQAFSGAL